MKDSDKIIITTESNEMLPLEKFAFLQKELGNIRDDFSENKYILEAAKVLKAGGLRSTIGSYWNAVIDDLRKKVIHRSIDLFNKEMSLKKTIKSYEDFQDHVTDFSLIDGAYKIGVLSWEGKKLLHQARETRNIFDGHPDSSDPTLFKVFNMIADCNKYVLSQESPPSIIDTNEYILNMDKTSFNRNNIAVAQAFSDLPAIYKTELINKLFTIYLNDSTSTILRGNIEFSLPILWDVLPKEDRKLIGQRFDKELVKGDKIIIEKSIDFMSLIDGMRYTAGASRNIIFEPAITQLENNLDNWTEEQKAVSYLKRIGSIIPSNLIERYVSALTLTYLGYGNYHSWAAAATITSIFKKFDNSSIEAFRKVIETNITLKGRIQNATKLTRLRSLGTILQNETTPRNDLKEFLEFLTDTKRTSEFYSSIKGKKKKK